MRFILLFLYAPLVAIVWKTFTMPTFVFQESLLEGLIQSLWIGALSSIVTTLLCIPAVLSARNGPKWQKSIIEAPVFFPEIVLGISLLMGFTFVGIPLGAFALVISHITMAIPYCYLTLWSRDQGRDEDLEAAARTMGCTSKQVFFRVTLPWLFPGILGALILGFVLSFDDFLVSFFMATSGAETLPVRIYSLSRSGLSPAVLTASSIIIVVTLALVGLGFLLISQSHARITKYKR